MELSDLVRVIKTLTETRGIEPAELLTQGRGGALGRPTKDSARPILATPNAPICSRLPPPAAKSLKVHPTWMISLPNERHRVSTAPMQDDVLQCSVFVTVMLAKAIKAWRTEVDQIPLEDRNDLNKSARLLMAAMSKDWTRMDQEAMKGTTLSLAKAVREVMAQHQEGTQTGYAAISGHIPVLEVMEWMFKGLRQVSFTVYRAWWCACCSKMAPRRGPGRRRNQWNAEAWISNEIGSFRSRLIDVANRSMETHMPYKKKPTPCPQCQARLHEVDLILDQAPPTLILGTGYQGVGVDAHDDWTWTYMTETGKRHDNVYRWKADIYANGSHFSLSWRDDEGRCWYYDGLQRPPLVEQSFEWVCGREPKWKIGARIYEMVEMGVWEG